MLLIIRILLDQQQVDIMSFSQPWRARRVTKINRNSLLHGEKTLLRHARLN